MKKLLLTVVGVAIVFVGFITILCLLPCKGDCCHHGNKCEMKDGDGKCSGDKDMCDGNENCTVKFWTDADGKMHKQVMMMKGGDDGMCMGDHGKCPMDSGKCGMNGLGNGQCNMHGMDSGKCNMEGMEKCNMGGMGKCNMEGGMQMGCGMNMNGGCCCCCMMMMKMMQENGCCKDDGKCDMKKDSVKVKVRGKL